MKLFGVYSRCLAVAAAALIGLGSPAFAQAPAVPPPAPPDEVDQLAQMLDLTAEQQSQIRELIAEMTPRIDELTEEAQRTQEELYEKAGPDFDEAEIRRIADRLGELSGEITGLTVILQSKVQQIFTAEQREELANIDRQHQQMQQEQMQRQLQQQLQQQQPQ